MTDQTHMDARLERVARGNRWPNIAPFVTAFLRARSTTELKLRYRRALAHFGFAGFGYWGGLPTNRFSLIGESDASERYGVYMRERSLAMKAAFERFEPKLREIDNDWKKILVRPALECTDSPPDARAIHVALCQAVSDFGIRPYWDVLIVPTESAADRGNADGRVHVHLPIQFGAGSSDLVAGISLTRVFDCLLTRLSEQTGGAGKASPGTEPRVRLTDREMTVLRLAATGKSHQQIAELTGRRRGEVRYLMTRARDRYGFATTIQTIVQAAKDHGWR